MGYYAFYVEEGKDLTLKSNLRACPIRSTLDGNHICKQAGFSCVGGLSRRPDFCPLVKLPKSVGSLDVYELMRDYHRLYNKLQAILREECTDDN